MKMEAAVDLMPGLLRQKRAATRMSSKYYDWRKVVKASSSGSHCGAKQLVHAKSRNAVS